MMFARSSIPVVLGLALLAAAAPGAAQAVPSKTPLVRIVGSGEKVRAAPSAQALRRYAGKRLTVECGRPVVVLGRSERTPASVSYGMTVRKGASVSAWASYCVARVHLGGQPGKDPQQLFTPGASTDGFVQRLQAVDGLRRAYRGWQNVSRNPTIERLIAGDKTGTFVAASGPDATAPFPHVAVWALAPAGGRPTGGSRASTTADSMAFFLEHSYVTNAVSSNAFDYFEQLDQAPALSTELLAAWKPHPKPAAAASH